MRQQRAWQLKLHKNTKKLNKLYVEEKYWVLLVGICLYIIVLFLIHFLTQSNNLNRIPTLLSLKGEVINPICLPFKKPPIGSLKTEMYIAGWGLTKNNLYKGTLQEARVEQLSQKKCYNLAFGAHGGSTTNLPSDYFKNNSVCVLGKLIMISLLCHQPNISKSLKAYS